MISILPITGIGEVRSGDVLADLILSAAGPDLVLDRDVLVVAQKVVAKAEGRLVAVDPDDPRSHKALVHAEAVRVLRERDALLVAETAHGFVCADAGVGTSNVEPGWAALLPVDPDRSARRIRDGLRARLGVEIGVIVSDTFGRPWRRGVTGVAIGVAGIAAVRDAVAVADELAAAAHLVTGTTSGIPVALVRGVDPTWFRDASVAAELIRSPTTDLFR